MTHPHRSTRGPKRWLAAAAAVAVGSAVLPISAAGAAIDTTEACPPEIPSAGFTDVTTNPAAGAIDCLATYGITQGVTETTYGPAITVNRGQVATFLVRVLEAVDGVVLPEEVDDAFDDDDGYVPHEDNINLAYDLGIIDGYADGTFRPRDLVSRAQMAKLVAGTLVAAGVPIPEEVDDAFDDDDGTTHELAIDLLAALEVVEGVEVRTYDPSGTVRRDTMARFLTRSVQVLVDADAWEPWVAPPVAPTALGALLAGGDNFTFGDQVGDTITVAYDGPVAVDELSTLTIDVDGPGAAEPVVFNCGPQLPCAAAGNAATFTVGDAAAVTGDVLLDEGAQVVATTGVTGDGGTTPDASYPADLVVNVIRTDLTEVPAIAGASAEIEVEAASNVAVAGASFGILVDATCVDTDADEVGDDPGFTLEAVVDEDTSIPLDLVCGDGVVAAAFPEAGIDLVPMASVFVPMAFTFDEPGTYPVAFTLLDAELAVLAASAAEVAVAPPV